MIHHSLSYIYKQIWINAEKDFQSMGIDANKTFTAPYSILKAKLYSLSAAILVKYVQNKKSITPNLVTLIYALSSFISILLFLQDHLALKIVALFNFFLIKGMLDWSDGALARLRGTPSELGRILDIWGAHVNNISFYIIIFLHVYSYEDYNWVLFLLIFTIFFKSIDLHDQLFKYHPLEINTELLKTTNNSSRLSQIKILILEIIKWPISDRARTIDTYLVIILLELTFLDGRVLTSICLILISFLTMLRFFYNLNSIRTN